MSPSYQDRKECAAYIFETLLEPLKQLTLALNTLFLNRNILEAVVAGVSFFFFFFFFLLFIFYFFAFSLCSFCRQFLFFKTPRVALNLKYLKVKK